MRKKNFPYSLNYVERDSHFWWNNVQVSRNLAGFNGDFKRRAILRGDRTACPYKTA